MLSGALGLFSFNRCVTVDRNLRHVIVDTRYLWLLRRSRMICFDRIDRVAFDAMRLPSLGIGFFGLADESEDPGYAIFFIGIVLKNTREDLRLFSVWERQPRRLDLLDRIAGVGDDPSRLGDEVSVRIATLLRDYLSVPIGRF